MEKTKRLSISRGVKYLPVLIILLSLSIIIGSTFAYFTDTKDEESSLTFAKVELSNETSVGINGSLKDVIPGTPLISSPVQFSKGIDSEPIYVRAKLSFSLPAAYKEDAKMLDLLDDIRNSTEFNIKSEEQHDAVWSNKQGNYYYLLSSEDNAKLKVVDTIDTYTLSNEIVVPRDLKSLEDNYQYMKSINFHVAFEAIQADNVSDVLSETKETFNVTFPESEAEKFVASYTLTLKGIDLTSTYDEVKVREGSITVAPEAPVHTNPKAQFVGWYTEDTFENEFTFGTTINQDYTLYPRYSSGEKLTIMDSDNVTVLEEIVIDEDAYVKEPTSLQLPVDADGTHTKAVEGWYTESSYQNKYVFGSKLEESATLYPKLVDVSTGLAFSEVYEEVEVEGEGISSMELVGYAVSKGECTDTEVVIPQVYNGLPVIQVADYAFGESDVEKVVLPATIKVIKLGAFYRSNNLIDINLPASLVRIEENVFDNCIGLERITIPDGVEELNGTFSGCVNLKEIKLPKNIRVIGGMTFYDCYNLVLENLPETVEVIGISAFHFCRNVSITKLPSGLTSVGDYGFYRCSKLMVDNLPESLESIGEGAFKEAGKIKNLVISKNINSIGYDAFTSLYVDTISVVNNENYNDANGSNILVETATKTILKAGAGVTSIPTNSNSVTAIGAGAFYNALNLTSIVIPETITSIGYDAFGGCYKLVQVRNLSGCELSGHPYWGNGVEVLTDTTSEFTNSIEVNNGWEIFTTGSGEKYLFGYRGSGLSGEIPNLDGVSQIYNYAFYNNEKINITSIPASITYINQYAFYGCTNIVRIDSMENIQNLANSLFENCLNLESVAFAINLQTIDSSVFKNCVKLSNVVLPETVMSVGYEAFAGCNLIPVENDLRYVTYANGDKVIVEALNKTLTEVEFPGQTVSIGTSVFMDMYSLERVDIPEGVVKIQDGAFWQCLGLTTVTFPSTLKIIGQQAFYMCPIESVEFPDGLEQVGGSSFARSNITSVEFPASVTSIGWGSFEQVNALQKVVINNVNCWIENAFTDTPNLIGVVLVSLSGYVSESWNNFGKEILYYGTSEQWDALEGAEYITRDIHFYKEGCMHTDEGCWQYGEDDLPIIGMSIEEVIKQEATCSTVGIKDIVCIHCDEVLSENVSMPKLPHNFVDGECCECHTQTNYTITQGQPYGFEWYESDTIGVVYYSTNRYIDNTTCSMTITATVDVVVSFEYWVDSWENDDYFSLLINSEEELHVYYTDWKYIKYSVTINAGDVLTFSYVKNEESSMNNDKMEIKHLTIADV